jgi:hypothetical protein
MNLAFKIGFWVGAFLLFAALPNLGLRAHKEFKAIGISWISEKDLRDSMRSVWWFQLGIAALMLTEGLLNGRALDGVLTALLFVVFAFRLRQVKPIQQPQQQRP